MKYYPVYEVTDLSQFNITANGVVECIGCSITGVEYNPSISELTSAENIELKAWIFTMLMIAYIAGKGARFLIKSIYQGAGVRG